VREALEGIHLAPFTQSEPFRDLLETISQGMAMELAVTPEELQEAPLNLEHLAGDGAEQSRKSMAYNASEKRFRRLTPPSGSIDERE
jgi:hypothetical protein